MKQIYFINRILKLFGNRRTLINFGIAIIISLIACGKALADDDNNERKKYITYLTNEDFKYGTYIIDKPGIYKLAEDISFNPNSPQTLTEAVEQKLIPPDIAELLELPKPVDAFHAGFPLFTQFIPGGVKDFSPGGPLDARYDPAGFGLGFFAAIVITSKGGVVLDLNGYTLEQSAEHALLQRFFSVIELAEQPFIPAQGPANFGDEILSAENVVIKNGTIGRSSHHGIHGNGNKRIYIKNVNFVDYEVGAVALNGVKNLVIKHSNASNRKDVPVLGTFSSAQFIKAYVEELDRNNSTTVLRVNGVDKTIGDIKAELKQTINNVHKDIIVNPNIVDGRAQINKLTHSAEYAVFANPLGVVDGNSYSYLVNTLGVAVLGFPSKPDGKIKIPAENVVLVDVHVNDQQAFINEVVALNQSGPVIDPVGAVFQTRNLHPDTSQPVTISSLDDSQARYTGNVIANAQAFVAKAFLAGEFEGSRLDLSRLNITAEVLKWIEASPGHETLDSIVPDESGYLCNGDSMFHVNKGVIAFKMDAAKNMVLKKTSVNTLENLGDEGSSVCGDYSIGKSHPDATLPGYGGARTRAYSFAGSENVFLIKSEASDLVAKAGSAIGVDVLTDSKRVRVLDAEVDYVSAGLGGPVIYEGPNESPTAIGFKVGEDAKRVALIKVCADLLDGFDGSSIIEDDSGMAFVRGLCQ